jgi:predicted HD phosphohydrolase
MLRQSKTLFLKPKTLTSSRFFHSPARIDSVPFFNQEAFRTPLVEYFILFPPPAVLLKFFSLHNIKDDSYPWVADILREMNIRTDELNKSAAVLLEEPIERLSIHDIHSLTSKQEEYCAKLLEVMNNKLSQRNYEPHLADRENVNERQHALEASKIGRQLGFSTEFQLVLFLHDIGRITHVSVAHGHKYHAKEGGLILEPLGLSEYPIHHAFAKFLLNEFCPPYKTLISPLSITSLSAQNISFQSIIENLQKMEPKALLQFCYKMMTLRAVEEFGKCPVTEFNHTDGEELFLNDAEFEFLIKNKLHTLNSQLKTKPDARVIHNKNLDVALDLLNRTPHTLREEFDSPSPRPR